MKQIQTVIDTDIHSTIDAKRVAEFLPQPWRWRYESGNRGAGHPGYWNPNGVMRSDAVLPDGTRIYSRPDLLARHFFDEYHIEYGVLNAGSQHIGLSPEAEYAAAVVAAENDVLAEDWLPADPRIRAAITVSPADPEEAAAGIRRHGGNPGFVQVLMPSAARMPYGQKYFHPIYAAACDFGLPVAIHPGSEGVGISYAAGAAGYPSSYLEWHTGLVTSYIAHLVSLITEGVFVKFPDLRFVLTEGGVSWLPPLLWRLDKNWKALRVTTPWLTRPPSEIVFEHFFMTTQPIEEPENREHLHRILEMFPAEKMLMFSSDYPHWDGDAPDFAARSFPERMRENIMRENARRLYRLPSAPLSGAASAPSAKDVSLPAAG